MSTGLIITVIICGTIIVLSTINTIKELYKMKKLNEKINDIFKEEK